MFDNLDECETEKIIQAIVPKNVKTGEIVIQQHDRAEYFYVVEKGHLECTKRYKGEDNDTFLKEYKPGESFGELALLYNAPRAATLIAKEDCLLWSLDRLTFTVILKDAISKKRLRIIDFLNEMKELDTLDEDDKQKLSESL